jgi:hypothetical protein
MSAARGGCQRRAGDVSGARGCQRSAGKIDKRFSPSPSPFTRSRAKWSTSSGLRRPLGSAALTRKLSRSWHCFLLSAFCPCRAHRALTAYDRPWSAGMSECARRCQSARGDVRVRAAMSECARRCQMARGDVSGARGCQNVRWRAGRPAERGDVSGARDNRQTFLSLAIALYRGIACTASHPFRERAGMPEHA